MHDNLEAQEQGKTWLRWDLACLVAPLALLRQSLDGCVSSDSCTGTEQRWAGRLSPMGRHNLVIPEVSERRRPVGQQHCWPTFLRKLLEVWAADTDPSQQ